MNPSLFRISASTLPFLETLLAEELKQLGATDIKPGKRIVHCTGDKKILYKANLLLRTALRVFVPICTFNIRHSEELYKRTLQMKWDEYLDPGKTFAIEPNVHSAMFKHGHFASLRLKDAIADYFVKQVGRRPDVNPENPDVLFNLHIDEHRVTISLDSSGESLNRRGYRKAGAQAPLNEALAAGMLLHTGWQGETPLYDPMCGSGTLAIEAAMLATNTPSQIQRSSFGLMNWKSFDPALWYDTLDEAKRSIKKVKQKIVAGDADRKQFDAACKNIASSAIAESVELHLKDFFETTPETESGIVVMNPPYGERLQEQQINHFYKRIGSHLKHSWSGHGVWLITSNKEALKQIGLKASVKYKLMNGPLECIYQRFDMFQGSHAQFKTSRYRIENK